MKDFQQRVVQEYGDLLDKRNKLSKFLRGEIIASLSDKEQLLLKLQFQIMCTYLMILDERIKLFK